MDARQRPIPDSKRSVRDDGKDDLACRLAIIDDPQGLGGRFQRHEPVDRRAELAGRDQVFVSRCRSGRWNGFHHNTMPIHLRVASVISGPTRSEPKKLRVLPPSVT